MEKGCLFPAFTALYSAQKELYKFFHLSWNETHLIVSQCPIWNNSSCQKINLSPNLISVSNSFLPQDDFTPWKWEMIFISHCLFWGLNTSMLYPQNHIWSLFHASSVALGTTMKICENLEDNVWFLGFNKSQCSIDVSVNGKLMKHGC